MSKILFLATHIGSEYERLQQAMIADSRIDGFNTDVSYDHYDKIETLLSNPHKNNKSNSIWMDILLHNHNFSCKPLIKICKFVYLMREPRASLTEILSSTGYDQDRAARYYCYRLSGLCEYAIRTGGYVLTHDRLEDLSGLAKHLGLCRSPSVSWYAPTRKIPR